MRLFRFASPLFGWLLAALILAVPLAAVFPLSTALTLAVCVPGLLMLALFLSAPAVGVSPDDLEDEPGRESAEWLAFREIKREERERESADPRGHSPDGRARLTVGLLLGFGLIFAPLMAFADVDGGVVTSLPPAASSNFFSEALAWVLANPGTIFGGLSTIAGLLGLSKYLDADRQRQVALVVYHAFHIVEDADAEANKKGASPILDKATAGLAYADAYLKGKGWRPLKPGEEAVAKLTFQSMNAQQNTAYDLAAAATGVVPKAAPASPANPQ